MVVCAVGRFRASKAAESRRGEGKWVPSPRTPLAPLCGYEGGYWVWRLWLRSLALNSAKAEARLRRIAATAFVRLVRQPQGAEGNGEMVGAGVYS